ncbi:MAG: hypothetical protein FJX75_07915 [Armatimonadetes bacterium]|nr:hypothetical protein [Armatimonadota bacterium]
MYGWDATLWRMKLKELLLLPPLPGTTRAGAYDVSNQPMVVGWCGPDEGPNQACEWNAGEGESPIVWGWWRVHPLGSPGGSKCASEAIAVNDKGQIVGRSESAPGSKVWRACLWERDPKGEWVARDLGTLP